MERSGYVLAGFETLATILDNFIAGRRGRYEDNFTRKQISDFLSKTMSGFLHSYGQDFPGKKKYHKYSWREGDMYQRCRDMGIFDGCTFIADSGGFQISVGRLTRDESELLYNMYYEWLVDYRNVYDKAFILDIPPGPGCKIFNSYQDVFDKNLESYERARALPDEVRKKIIYVHHFRTPKLWNIYTKIMRDYDMFDSFNYHATGGIVANMSSDMSIPCIIYILPLVPLLNEAIRCGRNYLNFHILGGANFRDVLFYELFKVVVKNKHNIDLNITYDSSGIFKQIMHARFMFIRDKFGHIRKMNIKSDNIHLKFNDGIHRKTNGLYTVEQIAENTLNNLADKWNFKNIKTDGIYDPARNTFWEDVKTYAILNAFNLYYELQNEMREFAEKVYLLYEAGEREEFNRECAEATRSTNQGNITKKQIIKSNSILKSLDVLESLDEDYCHHLVDKCLAKDEFTELENKPRILTI